MTARRRRRRRARRWTRRRGGGAGPRLRQGRGVLRAGGRSRRLHWVDEQVVPARGHVAGAAAPTAEGRRGGEVQGRAWGTGGRVVVVRTLPFIRGPFFGEKGLSALHRSRPCLQSPLHPMIDLRMLTDFCYHRTPGRLQAVWGLHGPRSAQPRATPATPEFE
jgi:hypothetical protein